MPPKDIEKLREKAAKAQRELKEARAEAKNYYNSIVVDAIKTAIKKGALPRKLFDDLLDKYVTKKSDRAFMQLAPLDESVTQSNEAVIQSNNGNASSAHQPQEPQHQDYQHN